MSARKDFHCPFSRDSLESRSSFVKTQKSVLFIVLAYLTVSGLWVVFSDPLLTALFPQPQAWTRWSIYKGLFFVSVTGLLLYGLISRLAARLQHARDSLLQKTEEIDQYFRIALDLLFIADADLRFRGASAGWTEVMGYRRDTLMSGKFTDFIHPDDRQAAGRTLAGLTAGAGESRFTARCRCTDGQYRWIEWRAASTGCGLVYAAGRDITEGKRIEDELRRYVREKETLLHELNHRVNNNLQLIYNLMNLQRRNISDKRIISLLEENQNRVMSIALVHEKLYLARGISSINLADYVSSLVHSVLRSYNAQERGIRLKLRVEDILLDIEQAVTCGLIINEAVTNSLKYAFPDGRKGEVRVELFHAGKDTVELIIGDNGVGLPPGFDPRAAKTLGMRLICGLAEKQLDGKIELDRAGGTAFRIMFRSIPAGYRV